jgi:hypothetical protein
MESGMLERKLQPLTYTRRGSNLPVRLRVLRLLFSLQHFPPLSLRLSI